MPPPALDYAPPPTARRRWLRRLRRAWPVGLLLIVAGLGIAYGPGLWRRCQVLRLQEACMTAELPADRPVWESDPVAARAMDAARPGEYRLRPDGSAARVDSRWEALEGTLSVSPWRSLGYGIPTVFCHVRHRPDGQRRLVVVEGWGCTVIDPARWPVGDGPRVVRREALELDSASREALGTSSGLRGPTHINGGVSDPANPARFTAPFVSSGIPGTWEYRLGNDDRVTIRLLDPEGFIARASAAKAKAATAP